ncbi:unnamed protein product [Bursaphelenchus xylophilus]|uniref:(pine wood nematode) hypothetical protein n=1 Tax=Bursaphelenchus xylophilus TaxID=6326 RepID=A0A1I7SFC2_BURXY|nr:unnamed protein product [Bursaphelenchus xylophilus]CAG9089693.1 unnamed protein product [Bursaphelenchus xylophilus]
MLDTGVIVTLAALATVSSAIAPLQVTLEGGVPDRSFRYGPFHKRIQNESNFNEFCRNYPKLLSEMSRSAADEWVRSFCKRAGEQAACDAYYKLNAVREQVVAATIADFSRKNKWTAEDIALMKRVQVYRNDMCLSVEEECLITNGLKETLTNDQRHRIWPNREDCDFKAKHLVPNFKIRSCFGPAKVGGMYSRIRS